MGHYKGLHAWQKGIVLCKTVYQITEGFPKSETFGLSQQMRRAAVAIPSNLAEGHGRGARKDYRHFVHIARGSACELETQTIIAGELGLLEPQSTTAVLGQVNELQRMIEGLSAALGEQDSNEGMGG